MKTPLKFLTLFTFIFFLVSCYYDKEQLLIPPSSGNACSGVNDTFIKDVNPIIQSGCNQGSGCHGTGSTNGPGALMTYNQIKASATLILNSVQAGRMPLGSSLTSSQIQSISCWVGNGTLNN